MGWWDRPASPSVRRLALAVIVIVLGFVVLAKCGDDRYVLESDAVGVEAVLPDPTVGLPPIVEIMGPASVSAQIPPPPPEAVRLTPPTTSTTVVVAVAEPPVYVPDAVPGAAGSAIPGRCTQYEPLLTLYAPVGGWDVLRMSAYAWRETRCTPTKRSTTSDSGLLQINDINHRFLRATLGEWVDRYTLFDPIQNVRAAAALCTYWRNEGSGCYQPWS